MAYTDFKTYIQDKFADYLLLIMNIMMASDSIR